MEFILVFAVLAFLFYWLSKVLLRWAQAKAERDAKDQLYKEELLLSVKAASNTDSKPKEEISDMEKLLRANKDIQEKERLQKEIEDLTS